MQRQKTYTQKERSFQKALLRKIRVSILFLIKASEKYAQSIVVSWRCIPEVGAYTE